MAQRIPKKSTYMRLSVRNVDALVEIAVEEDRSPAAMADILLGLGIEAYRQQRAEREREAIQAHQKAKKREAGT